MQDCLFCKIAKKEIPVEPLYEDADILAFKDIEPKAPFHVLVIPKSHFESAAHLTEDEGAMLGRMFAVAARLVQQAGYGEGYRVVTNVGRDGGQSVPHLHFHILAGRQMGWPPG